MAKVEAGTGGICHICKVTMDGYLVVKTEDGVVHNDCVEKYRRGKVERCAHCDNQLKEKRMIVNGNKMHPECVSDFKAKRPYVPPKMAGKLSKFPVGRSFFSSKSWKERFFHVDQANGLCYFATEADCLAGKSPKGKINIADRTTRMITHPTRLMHPEALNPSRELLIIFFEDGGKKERRLLTSAPTWQEHDEWVRVLECYIKLIDLPSDTKETIKEINLDQEERGRVNGGRRHSMAHVAKELDAKHLKAHKTSGRSMDFPPSVDYRNSLPPVLTAVKDQGHCGSCWAHAATEQMETYSAMKTGDLYVLSQGQINQCTPNPHECGGTGGCSGAVAELAYAYATENGGVAQEWTYPYTSYFGTTGNCSFNKSHTTPVAQFTGYARPTVNSLDDVMRTLVENGPLAVSVDASRWHDYESGVFDGCHYANNITINHAVQLVGYGHDSGLGVDYWIIRNSWNAGFGEAGFIRLKRSSSPSCGWDTPYQDGSGCKGEPTAFWACGECGILSDTSYPIAGENP